MAITEIDESNVLTLSGMIPPPIDVASILVQFQLKNVMANKADIARETLNRCTVKTFI